LTDRRGRDCPRPATVFEGDILYPESTADSAKNNVDDNRHVVFTEDGQIRVQTVKYTSKPQAE